MDRAYNLKEVMAAVDAVTAENRRLYQHNEQLRGQLREARREARMLHRRIEASGYTRANMRHMIAAAAGLAVALTCLLHSVVIAGVMG